MNAQNLGNLQDDASRDSPENVAVDATSNTYNALGSEENEGIASDANGIIIIDMLYRYGHFPLFP